MTTAIPLPPCATSAVNDEWQADGDRVSQFFYGTTRQVGDVTLAIYGEQEHSGQAVDVMLLLHSKNGAIRDLATMRELSARIQELADEIDALSSR
jgi:hypothetical protein